MDITLYLLDGNMVEAQLELFEDGQTIALKEDKIILTFYRITAFKDYLVIVTKGETFVCKMKTEADMRVAFKRL